MSARVTGLHREESTFFYYGSVVLTSPRNSSLFLISFRFLDYVHFENTTNPGLENGRKVFSSLLEREAVLLINTSFYWYLFSYYYLVLSFFFFFEYLLFFYPLFFLFQLRIMETLFSDEKVLSMLYYYYLIEENREFSDFFL